VTTPLSVKRLALRGAIGAVLSAGLVLSSVAPALAGQDTTTTSVARVQGTSGSNYHTQLRLWESQRRAIADTFRSAVAAARRAFDVAKSQAVTSADRYAARTQFDSAIALAAENRSTQLIALGAPPSPGTGSNSHDSSNSHDTSNSRNTSNSKNRSGRESNFALRRGGY